MRVFDKRQSQNHLTRFMCPQSFLASSRKNNLLQQRSIWRDRMWCASTKHVETGAVKKKFELSRLPCIELSTLKYPQSKQPKQLHCPKWDTCPLSCGMCCISVRKTTASIHDNEPIVNIRCYQFFYFDRLKCSAAESNCGFHGTAAAPQREVLTTRRALRILWLTLGPLFIVHIAIEIAWGSILSPTRYL